MTVDGHVHFCRLGAESEGLTQVRDRLLAAMARHGVSCALAYSDSEPGTLLADRETAHELLWNRPGLWLAGKARRVFRLNAEHGPAPARGLPA